MLRLPAKRTGSGGAFRRVPPAAASGAPGWVDRFNGEARKGCDILVQVGRLSDSPHAGHMPRLALRQR